MPRLTGRIDHGAGAFVQLRDVNGDFVGEVRADDHGQFTFYAIPGHWRVVCLMSGGRRVQQDVDIDLADLDIKVPA